jgi:hypothetical protein
MPIGFTFPNGFELPPGLVAATSEAFSSHRSPTQTADTFTTPAPDRTTALTATTAAVDMTSLESIDAELSTQQSSAAHPAALSLLSLSQVSQSSADDGARPDWYVNWQVKFVFGVPTGFLPLTCQLPLCRTPSDLTAPCSSSSQIPSAAVGIAAVSRADGSFTDLTGSSQAASGTVGDGVCDLTYESEGEQSRIQRNEAFGASQHSSGSGVLGSGSGPSLSRTIQVSKLPIGGHPRVCAHRS